MPMASRNSSNDITRVTFDMPTVDHTKLKMLAAYHGLTMRDILVNLVHDGLDTYQECKRDHTPNAATKKAIEDARTRKGAKAFDSVEELFKELNK
jgi:hypothetical protein